MDASFLGYTVFTLFVLAVLSLDLGLLHRSPRVLSFREAAAWVVVWVTLAMLFCAGIAWKGTHDHAIKFLTGYLLELSLSVDNLFVFILVFNYFQVEKAWQHRVLFWGILGALIMRGAFIAAGVVLLERFHWILYLFGAFLVYSGFKIFRAGEDDTVDPGKNPVIQVLRKLFRITPEYHRDRFLVIQNGKWWFTPLVLVLVTIEMTDVVFALDSIPAIFGVTQDPFIIFTSNVFAILGLRAMYFLLAGLMELFRYLKQGVAIILIFIGVKMCLEKVFVVPDEVALGVVIGILVMSVAFSKLRKSEG